MTKIEEEIRRVNKLMEWEAKSCHFLYRVEKQSNISDDDLKATFNYVIKENYNNAEFQSLDDIKNKFKELNYDEQFKYFNKESIHVIDCTNLSNDTFYTFKSLYEIGKPNKLVFIYYIPSEKFIDYVMVSDQYHFKTATIDSINEELVKIHQYLTLKEKINNENSSQSDSPKKPKI